MSPVQVHDCRNTISFSRARHVQRHIDALVAACGLDQVMHQVLFSTRRFKQRGAHYGIDVSAGPGDADGREA